MKNKFYQILPQSFDEFKVKNHRDLWAKVKAAGYQGLSVSVPLTLTKAKDQENRYHAVFSTDSEDRHGDIVVQDFDLKSFKKNPVFLDSHNYFSVEFIIGKIHNTTAKTGQLEGDIEFADVNPRGKLARDLADGGFLNTTSIGFIPLEFDKNGKILKSELLEVSAVSVPAQPEATFEKDAGEMVDHVVTEEDLVNNPSLVEDGVKVGDTVQLPKPSVAPQDGPSGPSGDDAQTGPTEPQDGATGPQPEQESAEKRIARAVREMSSKQDSTLRSVARAIDELGRDIRSLDGQRKRKDALKAIRSLLEA